MAPSAGSEQSRTADSVTLAPEVEKDEFGRDIRPMSPNAADPIPPSIDARDTQPPEAEQSTLPSNQTTTESHDTSESAKAQPPDTHASSSTTSGFGLDTFDVRTFDPTSPSSWEALGTTWQLSCGYLPSQQELMQFVMAKTMAATGVDSQSMIEETWENSAGWPDAHRGAYGGRAWRGRGRGSGGHGHHRGYPGGYGIGHNQEQWGTMNMEHAAGMSDAIVLRGGADNHAIQEGRRQESTGATAKVEAGQAGSHAGIAGAGKMQRVGDKWIFVREPAAGVS
jgi:protein NRD1